MKLSKELDIFFEVFCTT